MEDKDKIIAELKAENVEIKTSYINFIAKLKREMITKDDSQDLKDTAKRFVEERNSLRKENAELKAYKDVNEDFKTAWEELKAENERLKEEKGGMQILIDNYIALTEKYHQTLQEIKAIAEDAMAKQQEYKKDFEQILDLITKAESEG